MAQLTSFERSTDSALTCSPWATSRILRSTSCLPANDASSQTDSIRLSSSRKTFVEVVDSMKAVGPSTRRFRHLLGSLSLPTTW